MRRLIRNLVPDRGISWIKSFVGAPDMANSLNLLKLKGFSPRSAVDIGAYEGQWSQGLKSVFPEAALLMIEPQPHKRDHLVALGNHINASVQFELLSDIEGETVDFYLGANGSSIFQPKRFRVGDRLRLTTKCLDTVLSGTAFECPDLMKIDVQGAEHRVLKGGIRALNSVEVLVIELSIVNSYSDGLLIHEMIYFLAQHGLFLYDIAGLLRVNRTRSVNEIDGIFVRKDSPLWRLQHFLPGDAPEVTAGSAC
jgi:FkbM family methyltransferase